MITKRSPQEDSKATIGATNSCPAPESSFARAAGVWDRALASGVDAALVLCLSVILFVLLCSAIPANPAVRSWLSNSVHVAGSFAAFWAIVSLVYSTMFHGSRGATLGKQALGIRIQRLSGKRLGYGRAFVRYWASWLSILPLMGGFWIAFLGPQRRTLHDWVCGSVAVRAESLQEVQLITTSSRYAGFWIRTAALFIDAIVLVPLLSGWILFCYWFADRYGVWQINHAFVVAAIGALYNWLFLTLWSTTPGKMVFELGVVTNVGQRIRTDVALLRHLALWGGFTVTAFIPLAKQTGWLGTVVSAVSFGLPILESAFAAFDRQKRALHDRICGTRVIHLE